jgi:hypothetical protein
MSKAALKDHGQAILETAKDHLVAALEAAPEQGWTSIEWADAAGLLMADASFPAVIVHHLANVLVREGRASDVGDGALGRFGQARRRIIEESGAVANAVAAPSVGPSPEPLSPEEQSIDHTEVEAVDGAEAAAEGPWSP